MASPYSSGGSQFFDSATDRTIRAAISRASSRRRRPQIQPGEAQCGRFSQPSSLPPFPPSRRAQNQVSPQLVAFVDGSRNLLWNDAVGAVFKEARAAAGQLAFLRAEGALAGQ